MKKITKAFLGIAFIVVLLGSMFVAAPASAGAQSFTFAAEPSDANAICAYGVEIYDVAVAKSNTNVIYIATSDETLKSTDQGRTWFEIHTGPGGTTTPEELVAVADDNADVVVYATNANGALDLHVRISVNGGLSFVDLGVPNNLAGTNAVTSIKDIDVSSAFTDLYSNTYRYVGVAGIGTVAGADFYYCQFGQYTGVLWTDAVDDNVAYPGGVYYNDDDFAFVACKFSPAFGADNIVYLLSQDDKAGPVVTVELHVFSLNLGYWDEDITGFEKYNAGANGGTLITTLTTTEDVSKAQIVFDPNFCGVYYSPYARTAYCSVAETGTADMGGVYRITENPSAVPGVTNMLAVITLGGITHASVWSMDVNADGTKWVAAVQGILPAGVTYNTVYGNTNVANLPVKGIGSAIGGYELNTGTGQHAKMTIAYAGANVVCAKAGAAGAFSLSTDNGYTFNDISLVNTWTTQIQDKAISADGTLRYVVSTGDSLATATVGNGWADVDSDDFTSVWYWDGTYWARVFVRGVADTFIIRASPVSFSTAYLADTAAGVTYSGYFYYTSTTGKADWRFRQRSGVSIVDLEVVNDAELYVAISDGATGYVCPLTYSGLYYASAPVIPVFASVAATDIASITLVSGDSVTNASVLAGSVDGFVAYTSNGGQLPSGWAAIPAQVGGVASVNTYAAAQSCVAGSVVFAVEQTPVTAAAGTSAALYAYTIGSMAPAWSVVAYTNVAAIGDVAISRDVLIYGGCIYYISEDFTNTTLALGRAFLSDAYVGVMIGVPNWMWGFAPYPAVGTGSVWAATPNVLKASLDASGTPGPQIWFINTAAAAKYAFEMQSWGQWTNATMFNVIYTDVLAVTTPTLISPIDKYIVQVNDETGIAYDVAFRWSTPIPGIPATFQIAADTAFTDVRAFVTTAAGLAVAGPNALVGTLVINWQPGEIYYWRVRIVAGPFTSLPSEVREIDVQAAAYPAPEMLYPANGATINSSTVSFSWSPMSGTATGSAITTTYTVWFGTDPNFAAGSYTSYSVTNTTGMVLNDVADGTYYWRVCTQIAPLTNWGATMTFDVDTTVPPTETVVVTTGANAVTVNPGDTVTVDQTSPAFIWAIIVIGAVLVIAIIVLIFRTRSK
ncbi:MAG: hypothetical protein PHG35_08145 [Dehalococcoidales bacterium]|nr:hypothetical protein [Dehalococcoidales bacterium]